MMRLTVVHKKDGAKTHTAIPFVPGQSMREILNATDHRVQTGCSGNGSCGLCLVRILAGETAPPNENEALQSSEHQLASGIRLACQVICENDLSVEIVNGIPMTVWRPLREDLYRPVAVPLCQLRDLPFFPNNPVSNGYGVCVDLGTTSISLSLFNLANGQLMGTRYGINPQIREGLDVMTRICLAAESPDNGERLQQDLLSAIRNALWDISAGDGIDIGQVCRVVLVGNTAMLALLTGKNAHQLLDPGYWARPVDIQLPTNSDWAAQWGIHLDSDINIIPPLAGFIGSDLTAGILATGLMDVPGSLLVDFGTNSEIALWDGQTMWITSAAGGPAFEGSGISCGMPAEKGAIYRLDLPNNDIRTIGETEAEGICGSGLVDLLADLVGLGILNPVGQFCKPPEKRYIDINERLRLTKKDVDILQRAKAAIAMGIQVVLKRAGMACNDLKKIVIAGTFGYNLDIKKAEKIGLVPPVSRDICDFYGNSALTGCERILLQVGANQKLAEINSRVKSVNLAEYQDFEELFFKNLFITPMPS